MKYNLEGHLNVLSDILKGTPVFSGLDAAEREDVQGRAVLRHYVRGESVAHHSEHWPYLFLVAKGEVDALKISTEGRRLLVARFKKGELFWGLAFFDEDFPLPVNLVARGACQLYLWDRHSLKPVFMKHPQTMWEVCRLMVRRMARASEIVEEQAFQPITGRLARLLLDSFSSAGGEPVARYLTLDDMALQIGTTREMVCRVLYQLSDQELVQVTRTELSLLNRSGLQKMAESV